MCETKLQHFTFICSEPHQIEKVRRKILKDRMKGGKGIRNHEEFKRERKKNKNNWFYGLQAVADSLNGLQWKTKVNECLVDSIH